MTTSTPGVGAFLRACRAALTPAQVGLAPDHGPRRVQGLRREEVAQLAAISVDYYTRLEQDRVRPSATVLHTLARALRLDSDQQTYLYEIAGRTDAQPRRRPAQQRVRPAMSRLLDQLTEAPAIVLGRRMDVLAWNAMASALYVDFDALPPRERNYVRLLFDDPVMRSLHLDWEEAAATAAATLRMEAAQDRHDPQLAALVGDLSVRHPEFRSWWAGHRVSNAASGTKHYRHHVVGDLVLDCDVWASPDGSGQRLMVLTADPASASAQSLTLLASWSAPPVRSHERPTV